jgi:HEAT repeat protein
MRSGGGLVAALAFLLLAAGTPVREAEGRPAMPGGNGPDSAEVARVLAALRASDPLVCAMATDILGTGVHWRSGDEEIARLSDTPASAPAVRERLREPVTDPAALRLLSPELASPSACVRRTAAALLGGSEVPSARQSLRAALASSDPRVREAATFGLGVASDLADATRLRTLLKDSDAGVVRLAAWAVASLGDTGAERDLAALLHHRDPGVRRAAAWALGRL